MSKILFITLEFAPSGGGVGRMYRDFCRGWPKKDILVWTASADKNLKHDTCQDENYEILTNPFLYNWIWPRWIPGLFRLYLIIKKHNVSFIIVGQVLPLGTLAWLINHILKIPYAVFVHGMDIAQSFNGGHRQILIKKILSNADFIICANGYARSLAMKLGLTANRLKILYPPPSIRLRPEAELMDNLRRQYGLSGQPVLLTIGRRVRRKGHETVIRALEEVWRTYPALIYIIIGEGPSRARLKVMRIISSRPHQIKFMGEVSDEESAAWLSLSTVFIMTPLELPGGDVEGFGIVYLEAGYYGKPVIASRTGGVEEAVKDGVTGILVEQNDVSKTAAAIIKLLSDTSLAESMGWAGRERIEKEFSQEKFAKKVCDLYGDIAP